MRVGAREAQVEDRHRHGLIPDVAPVRRRARLASSPSSDAESFHGEWSLLFHHEVDGTTQLVGEDGKGLGPSMLFPELLDEFLCGRVGPQKEYGGFGEGHFKWTFPIFAPPVPSLFPEELFSHFTSRE